METRDHLRRLDEVWRKAPVYFLTVCTARRQRVLAYPKAARLLIEAWRDSAFFHGWQVGRYCVMPDHVHFFAAQVAEAKSLSEFVGDWKKWTSRQLRESRTIGEVLWQPEFFDHVLRSKQSYEEKWQYVRLNPVRAGLVGSADEWPYAGECGALRF